MQSLARFSLANRALIALVTIFGEPVLYTLIERARGWRGRRHNGRRHAGQPAAA